MAIPRAYKRLVGSGYLAKELPPAFTSESMANYVPASLVTVGSKPPLVQASEAHPVALTIPTEYAFRRRIGIPSPPAYARLAHLLAANWAELGRLMDQSSISLSRPVLNRAPAGRALVDRLSQAKQRMVSLERASAGICTTKVDTSNFYGSIYTHAVDWAVRGKAAAKKGRFDNSLGNLLDSCLQGCHDRQTAGIAIGPDTSRIVSEVVMAAIDRRLALGGRSMIGRTVRYIDDVTMYASSSLQGSEFTEHYIEALSHFELTVNSHKTAHLDYVEAPDPIWRLQVIEALRMFISGKGSIPRTISAFSQVLDIVQTLGRPTPLRYFLTALPKSLITAKNWPAIQHFLTIAMRLDGICLAHAHQLIVLAHRRGYLTSFRHLETNLYEYLRDQMQRSHSFEVASTINLLTDIGTVLDTGSAERAISLGSDIVDLLLLEASGKVKRLAGVRRQIVDEGCLPDAFATGHWLLAYEVQRDNPMRRTAEFKTADWTALASANVRFMRDPTETPMSRWYLTRLAARTHRTSYTR